MQLTPVKFIGYNDGYKYIFSLRRDKWTVLRYKESDVEIWPYAETLFNGQFQRCICLGDDDYDTFNSIDEVTNAIQKVA